MLRFFTPSQYFHLYLGILYFNYTVKNIIIKERGNIILMDFFNAICNLSPLNLEKIGNKAAEKPKKAMTDATKAKAAE